MVILGIGAHPDDLDFGAAGTFAKWAKAGHTCYHLVCTDGGKGSSDPDMTEEKLIRIRQSEQKRVAKILGLKGVYFLKHHDTELVPDLQLKKEIVTYIRKLKPDIVVTSDPSFLYSKESGYINHTDHRAAGLATLDAVFPMARDRLTFSDLEREGLTPHKVKTVYLTAFENPNEIEDITNTLTLKLEALRAHESQIGKQALLFVKERAKKLGTKNGFKFAEGFIKLNLPY
jgi:LmbE family N-acetylglucosaminyl deacetylase